MCSGSLRSKIWQASTSGEGNMAKGNGNRNQESDATGVIHSVSREARRFPPQPGFTARALIKDQAAYDKMYRRSIDEPEAFWAEVAAAELSWSKRWTKVLDWQLPWARWFDGGELNVSANCLDRHLATRGDKEALLWEGEPHADGKI